MAGPVEDHGGEILKFIGDAMLAIFPIADDLDRDRACRTALASAKKALERLDEANAARIARGDMPMELGLALHTGPVMYGNIGAPERLDFTVIGPAVNLTARIGGLCRPLGRRLLDLGPLRLALRLRARLPRLPSPARAGDGSGDLRAARRGRPADGELRALLTRCSRYPRRRDCPARW